MKNLSYGISVFLLFYIFIINDLNAQRPVVLRDSIKIAIPLNEDSVKEKQLIKGSISRQNAIVWVIIHPMETSDYWVQQQATVTNTGTWNCVVNFGRPGNIDRFKYFEFRAVFNPTETLSNGKKLPNWPTSEIQSDVIIVIRK